VLADRLPDRDAAARLLGVSSASDEATVRRAFRAWAALAHPDHGGDAAHFQALCDARDALLEPVVPQTLGAQIPLQPRRPWRIVLRRPAPGVVALLGLGLVGAIAAAWVAGAGPLSAMPAALASALWCVAVSRAVLHRADHGHVIVVRSVAWAVATCGQLVAAAVAGISLIEALPLLAVPFVAVIAAVNPAAGLWRGATR
jgi:hypothetical protein